MTTTNPYLTFKGTCMNAFNFYKSVFGNEFLFVGKFGDMPSSTDFPVSEAEKEKIMHISLPISKETVIYGCDTSEAFEKKHNSW
jgi:PhnB protein